MDEQQGNQVYINLNYMYVKAPISALVDFDSKIKTNHNKQHFFQDNHYQLNTYLNFIEIPCCR